MKKFKFVILALVLAIESLSANAGSVAGTGGGTEVTQLLNLAQLVNQYAQQIQQYQLQGQQYNAQLKNLISNPSSVQSSNLTSMINQIGGMMSASQGMGGSLASIDSKFAKTFGNSAANTYSQNFTNWNNASKDTLQASMRTAGLHRDQYASDSAAITDLYNKSQSTEGTLSALQTLAKINIQMIQQLQSLRDLMASQSIASSTYLSTQANKQQAEEDANARVWTMQALPMPKPRAASTNNF